VEDVDGILYVSKIYVPTIKQKDKEAYEYVRQRMGDY